MGGLFSWLGYGGGDKREPIRQISPRIKNIVSNNFRGILGVLFPIIYHASRLEKHPKRFVECMWVTMFWMFFVQPMSLPCTALMPIFYLPMTGSMSSQETCRCYFNEGVALFIIASMLILLPNNSGFDRRVILKILCHGSKLSSYSSKILLIKCSFAAFIGSMFSNRLIVTSIVTQYISPIITSLGDKGETDYVKIRYVINNGIQTSAAIGSIGIMHSGYCTHTFRTIFIESCLEKDFQYPDVFNYLQYSVFAVPISLVMFLCNLIYHLCLLEYARGKEMGDVSRMNVKNQLLRHKTTIPTNVTDHEKISMFCFILALIMLCTRNNHFTPGWAAYNAQEGKPLIKDVTMATVFVVLMYCLPGSLNFLKIITKSKKSELNLKRESGILFWRFANLNVNYSYFLIIGSGVALERAIRETELYKDIVEYSGAPIISRDLKESLLIICFVCTMMANGMSGVPMVVVALPFVLNMAREPAHISWQNNIYRGALGVGIAGSLGFMFPFLNTPAYICHNAGKVPKRKMAKYSILSTFICCIILWAALIVYAPVIFDPMTDVVCSKAAVVVGAGDMGATSTTESVTDPSN